MNKLQCGPDGKVVHDNSLPFDFHIESYNLLIEHMGPEHTEAININGCSDGEADYNLAMIQRHDRIKSRWAKDNGVNLLRISYKDVDNTSEIIDKCMSDIDNGLSEFGKTPTYK